jgi:hypothetical protein
MNNIYKKIDRPFFTLLSFAIVLSPLISFFTSLLWGLNEILIEDGCVDNEISFGWPQNILSYTTECYTCCDPYTKYPNLEVYYKSVALDFIYYFFMGYLIYKFLKLVKKTSR